MSLPSTTTIAPARARVAIITRTKERPVMLTRAMESVSGQTFRDFVWMVVNDGGDPGPVNGVADLARSRGVNVQVIHHAASRGMEAASNAGINASSSDYLCIHDDDDTWAPGFLAATSAFLDREPRYAGVISQLSWVLEVLQESSVRIKRSARYPVIPAVCLADMARINQFLPICFLFRRSALEQIGLFDESLPVVGDWEFNLRFLARHDIGVIPEYLAFYHQRRQARGAYGNSIHAARDLHAEYDALVRNRLFREDLQRGAPGLGMLVNLLKPSAQDRFFDKAAQAGRQLLRYSGLSTLRRWLGRS